MLEAGPRVTHRRSFASRPSRPFHAVNNLASIGSQVKGSVLPVSTNVLIIEPSFYWVSLGLGCISGLLAYALIRENNQCTTSQEASEETRPGTETKANNIRIRPHIFDALGLLRNDTCALVEGEMLAKEARRKLARSEQSRAILSAVRGVRIGGAIGRQEAHKHLLLALKENAICHSPFTIPPPPPPIPPPQFTPWSNPPPVALTARDLNELYGLHLEMTIEAQGDGVLYWKPGSREAQIVEMLGIGEEVAEEVERSVIGRAYLSLEAIYV